MTVTDQPTATDARCVCGCAKWDHKQGRATCKHCGCETYDPASEPELERLRERVQQLEQAVDVLTAQRDEATREANAAANKTARLRLRCEELQREDSHARLLVDEAREQRNNAQAEATRVRQQLADAEAALVEANEARRMRSGGEELHQRIARAALVVDTSLAFFCPRCRVRFDFNDLDHRCGELMPCDDILVRRLEVKP